MIGTISRLSPIVFGLLGAIWLGQGEATAERALLTVHGAGQDAVALDLADLRAMGDAEITTSTPWTEGPQTFTGVTGAQLAEALKLRGQEISAIANNDYSVTIPYDVFADPATLIAYEHNGQPMTVRAKGPLWIVFPFDNDSKYLSDAYRSYAIWGLERVESR